MPFLLRFLLLVLAGVLLLGARLATQRTSGQPNLPAPRAANGTPSGIY